MVIYNSYFRATSTNFTKSKFKLPKYVPVDDLQRPNNSPTDNLNAFKVSAPVVVGSIRTTMRARTLTSHVPIEVSNIRTPAGMKTTRPIIATDFEKGHKELCKNSWQDEYTKLHNHLLATNQNKFLVVTCSAGGWGNRLRELLCVFHLAVITKRAIIIDCNQPVPLDKYLPPRYVKWNYKVNETGLSIRHGYVIDFNEIKNITDTKVEKLLNYSVESNPGLRGSFYIALANLIKYDLPIWPNVPQMLGCDFYYLFKKSDVLENRLRQLKAELGFIDNIVLGIHIREGDSVFHHNKGDKRYKNAEDIQNAFNCATKVENKIKEKYNTTKIIWFLAADSDKRKTYAKEKYGNKVKYVDGPIEHIGHPMKGNEDAGQLTMLLDYFLMQESDFKLYTSPSTFDDAVEYISLGKPSVIQLFYRNQLSCKIPKYLEI